jgi:hypothetical protein
MGWPEYPGWPIKLYSGPPIKPGTQPFGRVNPRAGFNNYDFHDTATTRWNGIIDQCFIPKRFELAIVNTHGIMLLWEIS